MRQRLETLFETYAAKRQEAEDFAALCAAQEAELMAAIPEEIRLALAKVAAARTQGMQRLEAEAAQVGDQIKREVGARGHSVKHGAWQAVYTKGRVSWADDFLQGYAATHEEILQARKEGNPSVSIQRRKDLV